MNYIIAIMQGMKIYPKQAFEKISIQFPKASFTFCDANAIMQSRNGHISLNESTRKVR